MLIKPANLFSALTHIHEALSTLATLNRDEQGCFHDHITEQLTEAETLLSSDMEEPETNEPNERERGVIFTNVTPENKREAFSYRNVKIMIEKQPDQSFTLYGMGKAKKNCDHGLFFFVNATNFNKLSMTARRDAYETLKAL
jgi:hypothetical protein